MEGKKLGIVFCILYGASCVTKLWQDFYVLLLGRLLGGIATSLLFSVFEAWMVYEHNKRGFSEDWLKQTFSLATFGNGITAIIAGLVATFVADKFGFVAPFMVSLSILVIVCIIISSTWSENYGDQNAEVIGTFSNAWKEMISDSRVLVLGFTQSLFEASMYTFVFMWTPALKDESSDEALPFGLIFAIYMVCIMIGSSIFSILTKYKIQVERIAVYMLLFAAFSLFVPYIIADKFQIFLSFLAFEVCCGIWFPTAGTLRGQYIPERTRSAIMNFFRAPLNFLVVIVLLKISKFANETVFAICSLWLTISFFLANR